MIHTGDQVTNLDQLQLFYIYGIVRFFSNVFLWFAQKKNRLWPYLRRFYNFCIANRTEFR